MDYASIARALADVGLSARGGFHAGPDDMAPPSCGTVILVGNVGPDFWPVFEAEQREEPDPLDAWTRRTVDRIAAQAGGWGVYPSDGPPYFPFQRWAQKTEPVYPSPLGMLIHPDYGLWHAYRAAICLHDTIVLPPPETGANPCETCTEKPCLNTCPVDAFQIGETYDYLGCAAHLRTPEGQDCLNDGCRARRACPIAGPSFYAPGQAGFHMAAFMRSRDREAAAEC